MLCCEIVFTTGVKIYCYGGVLLLYMLVYTYVQLILYIWNIKQNTISCYNNKLYEYYKRIINNNLTVNGDANFDKLNVDNIIKTNQLEVNDNAKFNNTPTS